MAERVRAAIVQGGLVNNRKVLQRVALGALIHVHDGPPEILQADVLVFDWLPDTLAPLDNIVGHVFARYSV